MVKRKLVWSWKCHTKVNVTVMKQAVFSTKLMQLASLLIRLLKLVCF